jgi:hypothetical protein
MNEAALLADIDPDRLSFVHAIEETRKKRGLPEVPKGKSTDQKVRFPV